MPPRPPVPRPVLGLTGVAGVDAVEQRLAPTAEEHLGGVAGAVGQGVAKLVLA